MKIDGSMDISNLLARMPREGKRLAYAVSRALNKSAADVQTAGRVLEDEKFQIRNATFMYRLIKITAFASPTADRPFAEVSIDNTKARVLLPEFQAGGEKEAAVGQNVAVPLTGSDARPTFSDQVQQAFTFQSLQFQRVSLNTQGRQLTALRRRGIASVGRRLSADNYVWEGRQRTFLIPDVGVFERTGSGPRDVRMIYAFKRRVPLNARFDFLGRAAQVFSDVFAKYLSDEWSRG